MNRSWPAYIHVSLSVAVQLRGMLSEGHKKTLRVTRRAVAMLGPCIGVSKTMLS